MDLKWRKLSAVLLILLTVFAAAAVESATEVPAQITPQTKLIEALQKFHSLRKHLSKPTSSEALAAYKAALDVLQQVPGLMVKGELYKFDLRGQANRPDGLPGVVDMRTILYNAQSSYAPWGVEWMRWMIDHGLMTGFDLRVLEPYGKLLWVDIPILSPPGRDMDACSLNGHWIGALKKDQRNLQVETIHRNVYMRIFSMRIMEDNAWDILGKTARGTELSLRWGSVFYGMATVSTGGAAGVVVPLGFALLDSGLDFLQDGPDSICVDVGYASTAANYAYTTVTAGTEAMKLYEAGKQVVSLENAGTVGVGIGLLDFTAKAVQHLCKRDDYTAMVRKLADNNPPGYPAGFLLTGGTNVQPFPPVIVHSTTLGQVKKFGRYAVTPGLNYVQTEADYPVWELLTKTWQLDYALFYPKGPRNKPAMPDGIKSAERLFTPVRNSGLPSLRIRYAPRELFITVPLSRVDIQAACFRRDIPIKDWATVQMDKLKLKMTITPANSNSTSTPITLPVMGTGKPAGKEERHAVFRLAAYGYRPATAAVINTRVPKAYKLSEAVSGYNKALGPPVWTLDIEKPVPLKGIIEIASLPQPARFRFDASDRGDTKRIAGCSVEGGAVSWDLTKAKRILQPAGDLEVLSPKTETPVKFEHILPFRVRSKNLPLGWQKLAACIDGGRVYYWWARSKVDEQVVWDFRFLPVGSGEHTITFSLPDFPDVAPTQFTIKNILSPQERGRWEGKLKEAQNERDRSRTAGGSRARQLLNILDEMEAEQDIGDAQAHLRGVDQVLPSFERYEKLFRKFKASYRPIPGEQQDSDDLTEDEKKLHREAHYVSWVDVYTGRVALAMFKGDKEKTLKALKTIGESLNAEFQAGTAGQHDNDIYMMLGLLATVCSGDRATGRSYALRSVDVLPADKRKSFKQRVLESPVGWIFNE